MSFPARRGTTPLTATIHKTPPNAPASVTSPRAITATTSLQNPRSPITPSRALLASTGRSTAIETRTNAKPTTATPNTETGSEVNGTRPRPLSRSSMSSLPAFPTFSSKQSSSTRPNNKPSTPSHTKPPRTPPSTIAMTPMTPTHSKTASRPTTPLRSILRDTSSNRTRPGVLPDHLAEVLSNSTSTQLSPSELLSPGVHRMMPRHNFAASARVTPSPHTSRDPPNLPRTQSGPIFPRSTPKPSTAPALPISPHTQPKSPRSITPTSSPTTITSRRLSMGEASQTSKLSTRLPSTSPRNPRGTSADPRSPSSSINSAKRTFPTSALPPVVPSRTTSQPVLARSRQKPLFPPASPLTPPKVVHQTPILKSTLKSSAHVSDGPAPNHTRQLPVLHQIISQGIPSNNHGPVRPASHRRPSATPSIPNSDQTSTNVSPDRIPLENPQPQADDSSLQDYLLSTTLHQTIPPSPSSYLMGHAAPSQSPGPSDTETPSPASTFQSSPFPSQFAPTVITQEPPSPPSTNNSGVGSDDPPTPTQLLRVADSGRRRMHKRDSYESLDSPSPGRHYVPLAQSHSPRSFASSPQKGEFDALVACSEELSRMVKPAGPRASPSGRLLRRRSEPEGTDDENARGDRSSMPEIAASSSSPALLSLPVLFLQTNSETSAVATANCAQ
eukprot:c9037_g1_i2.p1 GENE.c9037_g1_i2~~c9037_g1_i2.p1  ORF type:complete len:671 (-),score=81.14 c9037_g1_i2:293-2305(-)